MLGRRELSLIATVVSSALCLLYLWFLPFTIAGMAALIGLATLAMMLLDRRNDIVTTGIYDGGVMVVAAINPQDAWHQPFLRPADAIVGVGDACNGFISYFSLRSQQRDSHRCSASTVDGENTIHRCRSWLCDDPLEASNEIGVLVSCSIRTGRHLRAPVRRQPGRRVPNGGLVIFL
jgi:hypothetical protein